MNWENAVNAKDANHLVKKQNHYYFAIHRRLPEMSGRTIDTINGIPFSSFSSLKFCDRKSLAEKLNFVFIGININSI